MHLSCYHYYMNSDKETLQPYAREHFVDLILDSVADGVFTVDTEWKITSFNTAAENIVGISRDEALGRRCHDIFSASICTSRCALRHSIETGEAIIDQKIDIINSSGDKVPISISTAVMRDADGTVLGGVETFRDLSAMEELRKEILSRYTFEDIVGKHQAILDIFTYLGSGSGRKSQNRDLTQILPEFVDLQVGRPEVITPLGNTMGLINGDTIHWHG